MDSVAQASMPKEGVRKLRSVLNTYDDALKLGLGGGPLANISALHVELKQDAKTVGAPTR